MPKLSQEDSPHEGSLLAGTILAFIILLSICFYVPLILRAWQLGDYSVLTCASGLELCLVLLVVAGHRTNGWRG